MRACVLPYTMPPPIYHNLVPGLGRGRHWTAGSGEGRTLHLRVHLIDVVESLRLLLLLPEILRELAPGGPDDGGVDQDVLAPPQHRGLRPTGDCKQPGDAI